MSTRLGIAAVAAATLALSVPQARADNPEFDCKFQVVTDAFGRHTGSAYGYVVHLGDPTASIRCYVTVNGNEAASTSSEVGVTAGRLSYTADDGDWVYGCETVTTAHGQHASRCGRMEHQEVPPDLVWDEANRAITQWVDPAVCPLLAGARGDYTGVYIAYEGDIYVDGKLVWDCPSYGIDDGDKIAPLRDGIRRQVEEAEATVGGVAVPPECNDGIDNDLNGSTDYPADQGCDSYDDTSESSPAPPPPPPFPPPPCTPVVGVPVCLQVVAGPIVTTVTVVTPDGVAGATHRVAGTVDVYRFPLPGGAFARVPCVVLAAANSTANPCLAAGGVFVERLATLLDDTAREPSPVSWPVADVCRVSVTVTVAGVGVESFPAYTLC